MQPSVLLGFCCLAMAGLATQLAAPAVPDVRVADAAAFEGTIVRVHGVATDLAGASDGGQLFMLRDGSDALRVMVPVETLHDVGPVSVVGAVARQQGRLVLQAREIDTGANHEGPPSTTRDPLGLGNASAPASGATDWANMANHPADWVGKRVEMTARLESSGFTIAGHTVRRGTGSWPPDGPVHVVGALRYDATCWCYRLDAWRAVPA